MARFGLAAMAASAALLTGASSAAAATVDNPGPFTATFDGGSLSVADGTVTEALSATKTVAVGGTIDENGNIAIPAASLTFPTFSNALGSVTLTGHDSTGTLDPSSGAAVLNLRVEVTAAITALSVTCTLGTPVAPFEIPLSTGTTGGVPYNSSNGTLTVANTTMDLSGATCNLPLPPDVQAFLSSGHNTFTIAGVLNPIIKPKAAQTGGGDPPPPTIEGQPSQGQPSQGQPSQGTQPPAAGCTVPKLKGLTLSRAKAALKKAGCKNGKVTKRRSSKKKGTVIGHSPRVGSKLAAGAKVALTVSDGPPKKKRKKRR